MPELRLGAYQLPAAEVVLLKTLLRLYAHSDENFAWRFADEAPFDALLTDSAGEASCHSEAERLAPCVLRLTRLNADSAPNTLARPIRADLLLDWLRSAEAQLRQSTPAPASTPAPQASPESERPAPHAEPAEPAPQVSSVRYMLRRWPPVVVLQGNPQRIRMATLLSRRALNAAELAAMSQQSEQACHLFLQNLVSTGLAQPEPSTATPVAAAPAPQPATPRFSRGLIASIRQRLGL